MTPSNRDRAQALPEDLREALRRRLAGRSGGGQAAANGIVPRADRGGPLPLSFVQQRLWFLDRLRPGDPRYNSAAALRFTGPLDAEALARALALVLARHEGLRSTFDETDGRLEQTVRPAPPLLELPLLECAAPQELDAVLLAEYSAPSTCGRARCCGRCWYARRTPRTCCC